jgi:hypothetical protein
VLLEKVVESGSVEKALGEVFELGGGHAGEALLGGGWEGAEALLELKTQDLDFAAMLALGPVLPDNWPNYQIFFKIDVNRHSFHLRDNYWFQSSQSAHDHQPGQGIVPPRRS